MATYAIGDIQGCLDSLLSLLDKCRFDRGKDRLWLVGDLVNRGPRSLETLRFVRDLGPAATTVLGNHDLYLLMVAAGLGRRSKGDTLDEILAAPDRDELLAWLRHRELCHLEGGFCLVHAGLLPQWTTATARALAAEVETALQGPSCGEFLANLWGSEPLCWSDELQGWSRLRVIVNAMTRMRFCSLTGAMDLKTKGEAVDAPVDHLPWFDVPGRRSAEDVVIIGHWSALGLRIEDRLLALDSGCFWGRHLTAVRLEDRALFQVDCANTESQA
ncbi:MAG TPA: symmetrical bis(5'-nucleosyl)-tetraphosphatase [Candidatus Accumulibacter phosphatis]|nr:MAG: Bis(5'-nucleosyl)-tetraphosphatase, symmetrical [Candidatus Accumulibacter sp. SK-11]HAY26898.1 symmetrical bis(5'-nucleosyl)-tetraphosphatase [Accumulibacter sp.]HCN66972.1 symmetrical bis(5'-nucleosyl)-tetraphosphatase [Accumulibacter sp.]HRL77523.1 symmetrical bis(5'-nucleosyl)-tetraphosphatase [Candidatus Accumulibacter phosphatis]HRQ96129.1 symmetrical bis(5'-nucleosyl)-tetraphosphatase [Candidatus Accumulibacter phosphatis]